MHYYTHHIGDYRQDTLHLTLLEHGIYRQLLDLYYQTENPLTETAMRLICARSDEEIKLTQLMLDEFFIKTPDGYIHNRCQKELKKIYNKSQKARIGAKASVESRRKNSYAVRAERMKAARAKGTHTDAEWDALRLFCDGKCVKCGDAGHQDKDHILPVYQEGSDSIDNIQPLCAHCNASKGDESKDYRPNGWQAFVKRTLNERSADVELPNTQDPLTHKKALGDKSPQKQSTAPKKGKKSPTPWRQDDNAILKRAKELKINTIGKDRFDLLQEIDAKGHPK